MTILTTFKKPFCMCIAVLLIAGNVGNSSTPAYAETEDKELMSTNAEWSYSDDGNDLGADWLAEDFDYSAWKTGMAPIGFGDAFSETDASVPLATEIGYGDDVNNKNMTTYAKTEIDVDSLEGYDALEVYIHVDDGAVVYFNGEEVFRRGIDVGVTVDYDTPAKFSPKEDTFSLPIDTLKTGTNTISAEIHQDGGDSSDLWFEMSIRAVTGVTDDIDYTKTPIPNPDAELGEVSRVIVSIKGDATTSRGFTWYTTQASADSDLQIVEKTADEPDFNNAAAYTGDYQRSTNAPEYIVHKAEATSLKPGTEYQYRVGDASLNLWSDTGSFITSDNDGKFTFIDLADPQAKTLEEAELSADTFRKAAATVTNSEFMVINGDIVDAGAVEDEWGWVFDSGKDTLMNTTVVAAAGNHDEDPWSFIEHFNLDTPDGSSAETGAYYSFNYENVHFIVLNNNEDSEEYRDFSVDQIEWLKADAAKAKADQNVDWIIAVMHKGPYTTSNHATDEDIMGANGVRAVVAPLFNQIGVDLVLQGHDHIYARTMPVKDGKATKAETIVESYNGQQVEYSVNPDGTVYLIPATAGPKVYYKNKDIDPSYYDVFAAANENAAAKYGQDPSDPTRPVRSQIQNFVEFNVDGNKLTAVTYEIDQSLKDGQPFVIDTFGIIKGDPKAASGIPKTGEAATSIYLGIGIVVMTLGIIFFSRKRENTADKNA